MSISIPKVTTKVEYRSDNTAKKGFVDKDSHINIPGQAMGSGFVQKAVKSTVLEDIGTITTDRTTLKREVAAGPQSPGFETRADSKAEQFSFGT